MPVLVFLYDGAQGWLLRNVGNGPALNIEVAQKIIGGEQAGDWINPVRVAPMGRDKEVLLSWLRDDSLHGLGAVYEDFLGADEGAAGRQNPVTCGNDRNIVKPGRHLPKWPESEICGPVEGDAASGERPGLISANGFPGLSSAH